VDEIVAVLGIDAAVAKTADSIDLGELSARFGLEGEAEEVVDRLIELRSVARAEHRYADADEIREGLERAGVIVEDGPDGTRWLRR
jgi:cysteinyl-tRNA synthetase